MPTRRRVHSRPLILDQTLRQGKKMNGSLFFLQKYGSRLKVVASKKHIHNQAKELKQLTSNVYVKGQSTKNPDKD